MAEEKRYLIKPLERFSIEGVLYYPGELRSVSEEVAKTACGAGWAEDSAGEIATGERTTTPKTLAIKKMESRNKTRKLELAAKGKEG